MHNDPRKPIAKIWKVGGIIADLYEPSTRGLPMSLFATASFSAGLGQLVSGFILEAKGWRWIHWHQLIINGVLMAIVALVFKETRGPVILSRRARALNHAASKSTSVLEDASKPRTQWRVKEDEQRATVKEMLLTSVTRPFSICATLPCGFLVANALKTCCSMNRSSSGSVCGSHSAGL